MQPRMILGKPGRSQFRSAAGEDGLVGEKSPLRISGRIPTQFEVTQDLAKWTPQLNRIFWIPGSTDERPVDWKAVTEGLITNAMLDSRNVSTELVLHVRSHFGERAFVACIGANGRWACDRNTDWWTNRNQIANPAIAQRQMTSLLYNEDGTPQVPNDLLNQGELLRWVYQHSVAQKHGLFGLAAHIGPKGGPELDDLPIYDSSDDTHALLIVVVPQGDDLIVYRKRIAIGK